MAKTHLAKLDQVQQQVHGIFEGLVIKSLEQRREAAAVGLTCRLLSGVVKRPLESLTPNYRDSSEGMLRRSARLREHKQQHQHNYSGKQQPNLWRHLKEVSEIEFMMSGMDWSQSACRPPAQTGRFARRSCKKE